MLTASLALRNENIRVQDSKRTHSSEKTKKKPRKRRHFYHQVSHRSKETHVHNPKYSAIPSVYRNQELWREALTKAAPLQQRTSTFSRCWREVALICRVKQSPVQDVATLYSCHVVCNRIVWQISKGLTRQIRPGGNGMREVDVDLYLPSGCCWFGAISVP